jgi:2-polyprenyl-3-methyl-5-hydroxy-6-metoxy-1,4-benzoquinol methylase
MTDHITKDVGKLYDEYPYPGHGVVSSVVASLLRPSLAGLGAGQGRGRLRLLDAGCGTGEQTLGIKRAFPEIEVVGIDLNCRSVEMARELASRKGLEVRFEQRNVLEPMTDLDPFDAIVSVGVLHHLPDPGAGLRALRQLIAPSGLLLGMVYGRHGKRDSLLLHDVLKQICGENATRQERLEVLASSRLAGNASLTHYAVTLRRRVRFGPSIPPLEAARRVLASRSDAYQADTFTHAHEEVFSYSELADLLTATDWRFEGWPRRSGLPDAPRQIFKGRAADLVGALPALEQATVYERLLKPMNLYFLASPSVGESRSAAQ